VRSENGGDVRAADHGRDVGWRDAFFLKLGDCFAQGDGRFNGLFIQFLYEVGFEREIADGDVEIAEYGDEVEDVLASPLRDGSAEEADIFADLLWSGCAHGEVPFWA